MLTLEPLSPPLATHLKTVRLRALQDTPSAFSSTYARESLLSQAEWLQRAAKWSNGSSSVCFLAMDEGAPGGIIACYFDDHDPPRPNVVSMWVAPEHRRTGLGSQLMNEVQRWAQSRGAGELRLMVTSNNAKAISFYERCGFVFTGTNGPYANDPALLECEMVKPLL
jgi:ribosomal protein S18 acetylase RimI-like enzyme